MSASHRAVLLERGVLEEVRAAESVYADVGGVGAAIVQLAKRLGRRLPQEVLIGYGDEAGGRSSSTDPSGEIPR